MLKLVLFLAAGLALAACTTTGQGRSPVCDGKHLRSANPYGSVLSTDGRASTDAHSAPSAAADKPKTFGSCQ